MAQGNFEPCFGFTLGEEGRYSGIASDPGNWSSGEVGVGVLIGTCWGISAPVLLDWVGPGNAANITADYMRNLSVDTAKAIYLRDYWNKVRGDDLPLGLDLAVWDFGVNAGVRRSIEELQKAIGVQMDGDLGPVSMAAIPAFSITDLINDLIDWHDYFYRNERNFATFGEQWLNRQKRLRAASLAMAAGS